MVQLLEIAQNGVCPLLSIGAYVNLKGPLAH